MPAKKTSTGKTRQSRRVSKSVQVMSMYIAIVIRNAMEDFHVQHLSDEQMKELNPIIRNAVCTVIYAFENYDQSIPARQFVDFNFSLIPKYWESARLTDDFLKLEKWFKQLKVEE
jgi:hypothetical protein